MEKEKSKPEHKDCLGRIVNLNDCVAVAHHNSLMIAKVVKLNPKMIAVAELGARSRARSRTIYKKYSSECAILHGPEVTMFLLKNSQNYHESNHSRV